MNINDMLNVLFGVRYKVRPEFRARRAKNRKEDPHTKMRRQMAKRSRRINRSR